MDSWVEITITSSEDGGEAVANMLLECGSYGVSQLDPADLRMLDTNSAHWNMIDEALFEAFGDKVKTSGYFRNDETFPDALIHVKQRLSALRDGDFGIDLGELSLTTNILSQKAWEENWRKYYKPFKIGENMVVVPIWESYEPKEGETIIHLEPGMAFGTGTHETTAMSAALLERHVKPDDYVIDVGCGSGILSVVALKRGARAAFAVDIDPIAVSAAKKNAELNGYQEKIDVCLGDLMENADLSADIVVANIIADVIIKLAPDAAKRIKPGGLFICSGIIRSREDDVSTALSALGLSNIQTEYMGEWVAMAWLKQ